MRNFLVVTFLAAGAFFTAPGHAACAKWDISGSHAFRQSNGIKGSLNLTQDGTRVTGSASFFSPTLRAQIPGRVEGYLEGGQLKLRMFWDAQVTTERVGIDDLEFYNEVGIYEASIDANGEVEGATWPFERPEARTDWFMLSQARCASAEMVIPFIPPAPDQQKPVDEMKADNIFERPIRQSDMVREMPPMEQALPSSSQASEAGAQADIIGLYDTDFGEMLLGGGGGRYDFNGGQLTFESVSGNVVEGKWTEAGASAICPGGKRTGRFRFVFDANGFKGRYGNCGEELLRQWNGKRR